MTATATHRLGKFVWRELWTPDPADARRFYGELFGWTFRQVPIQDSTKPEGESYTLVSNGGRDVAGIVDMAHAPQVPTAHWSLYVTVDDVDAAAARAVAAGGKVLMAPTDIPGVGRFAPVQDPQGAVLNLFREAEPQAEAPPAPGDFAWEHLNTSDPAGGIAFYAQVVGWGTQAFGPVSFFTRDDGATPLAVVSQLPPHMHPHWITYVQVADLDATVAKALALGGEALEPRIDVPGMGAYALLKDPQGVIFMLSAPAAPGA